MSPNVRAHRSPEPKSSMFISPSQSIQNTRECVRSKQPAALHSLQQWQRPTTSAPAELWPVLSLVGSIAFGRALSSLHLYLYIFYIVIYFPCSLQSIVFVVLLFLNTYTPLHDPKQPMPVTAFHLVHVYAHVYAGDLQPWMMIIILPHLNGPFCVD